MRRRWLIVALGILAGSMGAQAVRSQAVFDAAVALGLVVATAWLVASTEEADVWPEVPPKG